MDRLTEDQREVVAKHRSYAIKIAREWHKSSGWRWENEIVSIVDEATCEAVSRFNPEKNVKITSWIAKRVIYRIYDYLRELPVPLEPTNYEDMCDSRNAIVEIDSLDSLDWMLAMAGNCGDGRFFNRRGDVVKLIYRDGLGQQEIALKMGVGRSRISNMHLEAIQEIRVALRKKIA